MHPTLGGPLDQISHADLNRFIESEIMGRPDADPQPYCTDIAAAYSIFEHIATLDNYVHEVSFYNGDWWCGMLEYRTAKHCDDSWYKSSSVSHGSGPTAPLAICAAIIAWNENRKFR